ncbi:Na+/H+ antiporter subunit A [Paractinoplanes brasiliensis]|uniref:Multisubunit sodium/proton antiporter MrpA subunit /multisubunit sodium/proton antiporter MrpB subunit n=1 Tax=Paractinoplanes brasiliensis TaxID=52695 RepID=A0A4R6JAI0_9ACTN|nr:Na+/H+ antiporter subunit A [Actinoplanes brasiliensis]TDO32659.1 multisubunit sodium/proton antiporter MrpA subunit /multisubunit sodium/proton antiporter MrpB subunit [Actinoplanes brasiliensis]GID32792.1 Na+/H+ antiporter subunit A [Actinoplanes brasiliensis]
MLTVLIVHTAAALLAPKLVRAFGNRALYLLALIPAATFGWALSARPPLTETYPWVPHLGMDLALRTGTLSWLMLLIVSGIGAVVLAYCARYFDEGDPSVGRFAGVFLGFATAMTGLVVSDDLVLLYVFWELTTVFSYLLIGHTGERAAGRRAAMQALVVTTAGGLAMLVGFVMLGHGAGTYRWSEIAAGPLPEGSTVAAILILAGALSKSAIFPFSFWLPAAMAAPTPASAYLHAASMVKAGVFLLGLLGPLLAQAEPWRPVAMAAGVLTLLLGGWAAMRQHDLKLLLAYGTVSQLGLLTVAFGAAGRTAALAGAALLLAHALFKAALFLVVGIIDHQTGTRDLRDLSGLARRSPVLAAIAGLAVASMAGVPPLAGFVGKESLFAAFEHGGTTDRLVLLALVAGSALTVAYGLRFLWGAFAGKPGVAPVEFPAPRWTFVAPAALLSLTGLAAGIGASWLDGVLTPYADLFDGPVEHLALWHGVGLPLMLSAVAPAAGGVIFVIHLHGRPWPEQRLPQAQDVYKRLMSAVDRTAVELTGATQRGSLPFSLGVILLVLVFVGGSTLLLGGAPWPDGLRLWDTPLQLVAGAVVVGSAMVAARSRRRLTAMILVGVSGYGIAVMFVLHGAPDLALTQFLVETVTIVMFVLVLRRLPVRFSARPLRVTRVLRAVIAVSTGVVAAGMAYVAAGGRVAEPISGGYAEPAVSYGGGHNIVNVALVDIRAWDTMGEISVLVVAATGVASLIFRRTGALLRRRAEQGTTTSQHGSWMLAADNPEARRQSIILQVVARLLFHTIVLFSVYLLFSGHNAPGGGFAGGLVAGLALTTRYLAGGRRELNAAAPVDAGLVLGAGLLISVGAGATAMLVGGQVLQSALIDLRVPVLGHLHFATSAFFDVGVYLIVVALVLEILRSLGAELDRQHDVAAREERRALERQKEPV